MTDKICLSCQEVLSTNSLCEDCMIERTKIKDAKGIGEITPANFKKELILAIKELSQAIKERGII